MFHGGNQKLVFNGLKMHPEGPKEAYLALRRSSKGLSITRFPVWNQMWFFFSPGLEKFGGFRRQCAASLGPQFASGWNALDIGDAMVHHPQPGDQDTCPASPPMYTIANFISFSSKMHVVPIWHMYFILSSTLWDDTFWECLDWNAVCCVWGSIKLPPPNESFIALVLLVRNVKSKHLCF